MSYTPPLFGYSDDAACADLSAESIRRVALTYSRGSVVDALWSLSDAQWFGVSCFLALHDRFLTFSMRLYRNMIENIVAKATDECAIEQFQSVLRTWTANQARVQAGVIVALLEAFFLPDGALVAHQRTLYGVRFTPADAFRLLSTYNFRALIVVKDVLLNLEHIDGVDAASMATFKRVIMGGFRHIEELDVPALHTILQVTEFNACLAELCADGASENYEILARPMEYIGGMMQAMAADDAADAANAADAADAALAEEEDAKSCHDSITSAVHSPSLTVDVGDKIGRPDTLDDLIRKAEAEVVRLSEQCAKYMALLKV